VRLILYAILGFVIYYLLRGFSKGATKRPESPAAAPTGNGKELKRDPVCGTYIPEDTPYRLEHKGTPFYFCSEACMKTFQKEIAEKEKK
jgi:YHS domain-containing protein